MAKLVLKLNIYSNTVKHNSSITFFFVFVRTESTVSSPLIVFRSILTYGSLQ